MRGASRDDQPIRRSIPPARPAAQRSARRTPGRAAGGLRSRSGAHTLRYRHRRHRHTHRHVRPHLRPTAAEVITIDSPVADSPVTIPVRTRGTANTFEAALVIDLLDEDGQTLCVRHLMATSGSATPGTWQSDLAVPPPDDEHRGV